MITLSKGLQNSFIVLEYLRNNESLKEIDIHVGAFTNCREVGLTFLVASTYQKGQFYAVAPFTWCIYEHRNSDEIIINGKEGYISLNGDLPYKADSKYIYLAAFKYFEHMKAADTLANFIKTWVEKNIKITNKEANTL